MAYELLGKNFTPPDVHAKVTGKAKYSEDIRVDGMVFVKLLTSPMPHARVTNVDDSAALAMPGVHGVLRASEVSNPPDPQETILTDEPLFVGHPILAVAADTEELASDALEKIEVTYEELPFTVDPLQSLYPGGPNARTNGNSVQGPELRTVKWTAQDFAAVAEIHARLMAARNAGAAVLLISEDLDELLDLSDRILVISEGRIVHETPAAQADRSMLGAHMGGRAHDVHDDAPTAPDVMRVPEKAAA